MILWLYLPGMLTRKVDNPLSKQCMSTILNIPLLQFQNFKDVSMIQIILAGLSWFVLLHTMLPALWLVEKYFYQKKYIVV